MKTIRVIETTIDGETNEVEVGVNDRGDGFWRNGRQVRGTCDYHASLPRDILRHMRKHAGYGEKIKMVRGSAEGW